MINGHPTRTVLSMTFGIRDDGAGDFGIPHLREDGVNSQVKVFRANPDGSKGEFLRIDKPVKPKVNWARMRI